MCEPWWRYKRKIFYWNCLVPSFCIEMHLQPNMRSWHDIPGNLLMISTKSPAFSERNSTTFIGSTVTESDTHTKMQTHCKMPAHVSQTISNRKAFQNAGKIIARENELKYLRPQPKFCLPASQQQHNIIASLARFTSASKKTNKK